jgi:hypothetical protein
MTEVLRQHLAKRQITPVTWYALKLIAIRGPGIAREAVTRDLEASRTLDADSTRELLTRLETEALIRGDAKIDLTAEREILYRSLHEYVSRPTAQLLSKFPADDIETTVRTLQALTKLSAEELAAG